MNTWEDEEGWRILPLLAKPKTSWWKVVSFELGIEAITIGSIAAIQATLTNQTIPNSILFFFFFLRVRTSCEVTLFGPFDHNPRVGMDHCVDKVFVISLIIVMMTSTQRSHCLIFFFVTKHRLITRSLFMRFRVGFDGWALVGGRSLRW